MDSEMCFCGLGPLGWKFSIFSDFAILWGVWEWCQVIFTVSPCPLKYQRMLTNKDLYVLWSPLWGHSAYLSRLNVFKPAADWGGCVLRAEREGSENLSARSHPTMQPDISYENISENSPVLSWFFFFQSPRKGAGKMVPRENCRKCRRTFWRFLTFFFLMFFALRENCRKVAENFLTVFDDFWRGPFPPAPFAIRWFSWFLDKARKTTPKKRMRLCCLQLRSFCLRFVFFTYGGGLSAPKSRIAVR